MLLHEIKRPAIKKDKKRLGKGEGSGFGKQAGKGHKGQKARSGGNIPAWFEGGQMPLQRRLPKRGFKNFTKKTYRIVNLQTLLSIEETDITVELLEMKGFIRTSSRYIPVKVLASIEDKFDKKVNVKVDAFSKKAKEMIEATGGNAEVK